MWQALGAKCWRRKSSDCLFQLRRRLLVVFQLVSALQRLAAIDEADDLPRHLIVIWISFFRISLDICGINFSPFSLITAANCFDLQCFLEMGVFHVFGARSISLYTYIDIHKEPGHCFCCYYFKICRQPWTAFIFHALGLSAESLKCTHFQWGLFRSVILAKIQSKHL